MQEQWKANMRQGPKDASILTAVATFPVVGRAEQISLKRAPIRRSGSTVALAARRRNPTGPTSERQAAIFASGQGDARMSESGHLRRLGGVGFVPEPDIVGPSVRYPTKEFFNDVLFAPAPEDGQAKGTRSCALGSQIRRLQLGRVMSALPLKSRHRPVPMRAQYSS